MHMHSMTYIRFRCKFWIEFWDFDNFSQCWTPPQKKKKKKESGRVSRQRMEKTFSFFILSHKNIRCLVWPVTVSRFYWHTIIFKKKKKEKKRKKEEDRRRDQWSNSHAYYRDNLCRLGKAGQPKMAKQQPNKQSRKWRLHCM
jgi:hypothetical protein